MAIPSGAVRTVWYGVSPHGEIFETGAWLSSFFPTDQAGADGANNTISSVISSLANTTLRALLPSSASYVGVKSYFYPSGGPTATFISDKPFTTAVAGNGTNDLPLQTAMCITTLTGAAGRRRRGRIFLPAYGAATASNSFANTTVDNTVDGVADMMTSWNSDHGEGIGKWVVVSVRGSAAHDITSLRSDSRPDVIRRRANKFTGAHVHSSDV